MRHLVEVTSVVEGGRERWARMVKERRRRQGRPLPSIGFLPCGGSGGTSTSMLHKRIGDNAEELVRKVVAVSKEIGWLVVSFI